MAAYGWLDLLRQAEANRRLDRSADGLQTLDCAVPVAAMPKAVFCRGTRIEIANGMPVFRDEVDIKVYPGEEKCLAPSNDAVTGPAVSWRALDVVTLDAKAKGHAAVVATYPYSTDWFDAAPFKRTLHGKRSQMEAAQRAALAYPAGHIAYLRDEISFDVFETRPGYLTASLADPRRSDGDVATGRRWDRWTGGRIVPLPRFVKDPERGVRRMKKRIDEAWVFGICPDPAACREALRESDIAKALLDETQDRTVLERRYQGRRGARARELREDIIPHAPDVLESSIAKSLAGPLDWQEWTQRAAPYLVAELMRDIYLATIYALNERKPAASDTAAQQAQGLGQAPPDHEDDEPEGVWFARQLETYVSRFRGASAAGDMGEAARALASAIPEQRFEACLVLAALARLRTREDLPLRDLEGLASTDPHPDVQAVARMTLEAVSGPGLQGT